MNPNILLSTVKTLLLGRLRTLHFGDLRLVDWKMKPKDLLMREKITATYETHLANDVTITITIEARAPHGEARRTDPHGSNDHAPLQGVPPPGGQGDGIRAASG